MTAPDIFTDRVTPIIPRAFRACRALVIGCGSGGSVVASSLASCGIGHLTLMDGDTFELGNVSRHVLGMSAIGKNKAESLATYLVAERNPALDVRAIPYHTDYDPELVEELVASHDVVAACTDDVVTQRILNRLALAARRPISFGTCTDRVEMGKAFLVDPTSETGCFECVEMLRGARYAQKRPDGNYGLSRPMAGLGPFIARVAFEQAWLTLHALVANLDDHTFPAPPAPVTLVSFVSVIDGQGACIVRANTTQAEFVPINPACVTCQEAGRTPRREGARA